MPQTSFTERQWRNLLTDIEARQIIPLVGHELVIVPDGDKQTTLYDLLARELIARLGIDASRLHEDYDLFDVTSLYLQDPGNTAEDLHYEARAVLNSRAWPTPEPLKKLAAITHFDLFVSATVDSLLEQAINEVRFGGAKSTCSLAYAEKSQTPDIPAAADIDCPPAVFQLFGKLNATGDYAITEEKLLEFSHRMQSRDLRPKNLFDALRTKNMIALGCSFPGWLARFFLRATKGDELYTQGSRGLIADRGSRRDQDFVMFLERRKTAVYTGDGTAFVDELHRRWMEQFGAKVAEPAPALTVAAQPDAEFKIDSVFLSYASEDRSIALQVKKAFDDAGVDVWYDQRALESGDDYRVKIEKNIESCSYFVPLLSKNTAGDERRFFRLEWFKAIDEMKFRPPEFPFIQPIRIDDVALDAPGIPREFTARHIRQIEALAELVDDAKRRIRERRREEKAGVSEGPPKEPWLGLASYSETDSELFFGRERETEELFRLLKREVLTVVFGPSGTGKTSLLNAGLFPRLREAGYLPVAIRLNHVSAGQSHRSHIRTLLDDAVGANGIDVDARSAPPVVEDQETLWEYLHRVEFWDRRNNAITPVLVFDQFEEIFTLGYNLAGVKPFLSELADLAENYVPAAVRSRIEASGEKLPYAQTGQPYKILLSLREDYVSRLDGLRQAMPSIMHNRFVLTRMNGEQALVAVEKPGRGIVEPDVARQIVLFVAAADESASDPEGNGTFENLQVEPALLSVVCRELNARRISEGKELITHDLLEEAHTDILDSFYQRGFDGLDLNARIFVEDRLLTASGYRGTVPLEEAAHAGVGEKAIRTLVDRRLIRVEERLGIPHVELTHDLLTKVVQKSRDSRRERDRREKLEREQATREEQRRKQLRTIRRRFAIAVIAAGVFFVLGVVFTTWSYQKADAARMEAMFISRATGSLSDDPEHSVLLALYAMDAAMRSKPDLLPLGEDVMHRALLASQARLTLQAQAQVRAVAYSSDGARIATGGDDNAATLWDTSNGSVIAAFRGHTGTVSSVALSADGTRLITGSWDNTAKIWDTATGREISTLSGHTGKVNAVAISLDGKRIATASDDETIKIWDAANSRELVTLRGHSMAVTCVAFSTDATKLVGGGEDDNVIVWSAGGRILRTLTGHENTIRAVAFSPDGTEVASASADHLAKLWDVATGRDLVTFRGNQDEVTSVAFSPHGTRIATAGMDRTARIWDAVTGQELFTMRGHRQAVLDVAFNPRNENRCATASADKTAKLWEIAGSEFLTLRGHEGGAYDVVFSPDDKKLATAGEDSTAKLWDASSGQLLLTLQHASPVYAVAITSDGSRLATGGKDGTATLWDLRTGQKLVTFSGHTKEIYGIAISPGNKFLATASMDKTAKLWDLATGRELRTFTGHMDRVSGVAFSPDGTQLATAGSDRTAKVWDVFTGHELVTLQGHEEAVRSVMFSPDGKRLATAGDDFSARVWDVASGRQLLELRGHQGAVWSAAYSADGKRIATASVDKTAKLWDADSGQEQLTLEGHQDALYTAVFSPDGKRLATASKDESVQVFVLDPDDLMALARKRITRKLTQAECEDYFHSSTCPALP